MVPALTSQWSDRQKELDVKNALVSQITRSAATATQDAYTLVEDEAQSAMIKDPLWRSEYRSILKEWRVAAFTLQSELQAYFPSATLGSSSLLMAFHNYNNVVQQYIRLSGDECADNRQWVVNAIYSKYLHKHPWRVIANNPPGITPNPACWKKSEEFRQSYQDLGENLLGRRKDLVQAVIGSSAAGFNVGFRDFVHQVLPFF